MRTPKGLRIGNHYYSSRELFKLPKHLINKDREVTVIHDPRRHEVLWIEDPEEGVFFEIPNVLTDVMEGPLTRGITLDAMRRAKLRSIDGYHAGVAFAQHAALVRTFERTARIERELADWRTAVRTHDRAVANGATVIQPVALTAVGSTVDAVPAGQSRPVAGLASPTGNRPQTAPFQPIAHDDDLDRPIRRPACLEAAHDLDSA